MNGNWLYFSEDDLALKQGACEPHQPTIMADKCAISTDATSCNNGKQSASKQADGHAHMHIHTHDTALTCTELHHHSPATSHRVRPVQAQLPVHNAAKIT